MTMTMAEPLRVTVLAGPPERPTRDPGPDDFVNAALTQIQDRSRRLLRASSVLELDLALAKLFEEKPNRRISLQLVGHGASGLLHLGAPWLSEGDFFDNAFRYPFYVLDTNPAALGLLSQYAGRLADVMLVACEVGAESPHGYGINGRTLTYTLAELLRCPVRGADDVVAPDEFDQHGDYHPLYDHRAPTGWKWRRSGPPTWIGPISAATPSAALVERAATSRSRRESAPAATVPLRRAREPFEIVAITASRLPVPNRAWPRVLRTPVHVSCLASNGPGLRFAPAEISVIVRQGTRPDTSAALLCGGRFLRVGTTHYAIDPSPVLSTALRPILWQHQPGAMTRTG